MYLRGCFSPRGAICFQRPSKTHTPPINFSFLLPAFNVEPAENKICHKNEAILGALIFHLLWLCIKKSPPYFGWWNVACVIHDGRHFLLLVKGHFSCPLMLCTQNTHTNRHHIQTHFSSRGLVCVDEGGFKEWINKGPATAINLDRTRVRAHTRRASTSFVTPFARWLFSRFSPQHCTFFSPLPCLAYVMACVLFFLCVCIPSSQ